MITILDGNRPPEEVTAAIEKAAAAAVERAANL
jgi:hypothetical protein